MPLTLAQMLALLPDNTAGDISAVDARNVVTAIVHGQRAPYSVDDAEDIWWESDSAGMTVVTVTGTQTITEKDGHLSVRFSGQSASDFNGIFAARTFAVGDSFATRIRSVGSNENYNMTAIAFTDGTASTSNVVAAYPYSQSASASFNAGHGTLTAFTTNSWSVVQTAHGFLSHGVYARLTYTAANTFTVSYSPDGSSWTSFGQADLSKTMTPTHVGVMWSKFAGAAEAVASFGPICKLA